MALTPAERIAMACRMHGTARTLAIAGIKHTLGDIGEARLRGELFRRMYASDFTSDELKKIVAHMPNMEL